MKNGDTRIFTDVWSSTLWQFITMSICASTHLRSGCGFNKPVKGEEFVDLLVWTGASAEGSCSAVEGGGTLKACWNSTGKLQGLWIVGRLNSSGLGVGSFFGCKASQICCVCWKVLSTVISCCLVDLKRDVVSKIQKMDTSFIGLTPNHEVSWLTLVNAS